MSNAHAVHPLGSFETDIVVDLGCCSYQRGNQLEDSITTLIKRFKPKVLFGFDPHPGLQEGVGQVHGTTVITSRRAAWTFDGMSPLELQGNCTHLTTGAEHDLVGTFDIASFIGSLPDLNIVLKIDVEGAEYALLPHLAEADLMDKFTRVLIEWHTGEYANGLESDRDPILAKISCPVESWQ